MTKRWTIQNLQQWANDHGGKCLSKEYIGIDKNHTWRCDKGHVFDMRPIYVRQGAWCVPCTIHNQKVAALELMHEWADKIGSKCLSKEYINQFTSLKWKCKNGHTFNRTRKLFARNTSCIQCKIDEKKNKKLKRIQKIAASRRGKCLSDTYINGSLKLEWECEYGHRWKASSENVLNRKSWCPHCVGTARLSIDLMHKTAKAKGGKCLSKKYINTTTPLKWQCSKGHMWTTPASNIRDGTWCPKCHLIKVKTTDIVKRWTRGMT